MADAVAALSDTFVISRPEQLKALGHPLRLRVLETLGGNGDEALTNRELSERLGVDPGHLHFHVRMLLRAGLIQPAAGGKGREKPYRAIAGTIRVAPQLISSRLTIDLQAAMLDEVRRAFATSGEGRFRSAQVTVRVSPERALELMAEFVEKARDSEDPSADHLVITAVAHPPSAQPNS